MTPSTFSRGIRLVCLLSLAGCGEQPVRESRDFQWAPQTSELAFAHPAAGAVTAAVDGTLSAAGGVTAGAANGGLLASSSPRWDDRGERQIFATVSASPAGTAASGPGRRPEAAAEVPPEGRLYFAEPTQYTCWLRVGTAEARPLFDAWCFHPGYIAANLAVRWHPSGTRVLYIDAVDQGRHALFEFDLASGGRQRLNLPAAEAIAADWSPDGRFLGCALAGSIEPLCQGVWLRDRDDENSWRHVTESALPAQGQLPSALEAARASAPVWSRDGKRLAFATRAPSAPAGGAPAESDAIPQQAVYIADPESLVTTLIALYAAPVRDLAWSTDGTALGLLTGADPGQLEIRDVSTRELRTPVRPEIRAFAGWNARGDRYAVVQLEPSPRLAENWAFLFPPVPNARDELLVVTGGETTRISPHLRLTFPRWSPHADELALWGTFVPTRRSLPGWLFGVLLRSGDPAVVFDVERREFRWLPSDAHEMAQVGHYFLLIGQPARAWEWYERAKGPQPPHAGLADTAGGRAFLQHAELAPFEWLCLRQLDRWPEAQERLLAFRRSFQLTAEQVRELGFGGETGGEEAAANGAPDEPYRETLNGLLRELTQDFYLVEVLVSLNAPQQARELLAEDLNGDAADIVRFSRAVMLSQLWLIEDACGEYVALVQEQLWPTARAIYASTYSPSGLMSPRAATSTREVLEAVLRLALAPLTSPEFLHRLPADQLESAERHWREESQNASAAEQLVADCILRGLLRTQDRYAEAESVEQRIQANPERLRLLGEHSLDDLDRQVRELTAYPGLASRSSPDGRR